MHEVRLGIIWRGEQDGRTYRLFVAAPEFFSFGKRYGFINGQPVRLSGELTRWADDLLVKEDAND